MNDLVTIQNDRVLADSRTVAERFERRHDNVLRIIDTLIGADPRCALNFEETSYEVPGPRGGIRTARFFRMTRDGFSLLVMRFTGAKALTWQLDFIAAFNAMEASLRSPPNKALEHVAVLEALMNVPGFERADAVAWFHKKTGLRAPRRLALPAPQAHTDEKLERLCAAAPDLAQRSPHGFTGDDLCRAAGVLPLAVSPGLWETFRLWASCNGLARGETNIVGRRVEIWRAAQ